MPKASRSKKACATVQIDTLQTTNIYSGHDVALWIDSLAKRMNAA
jgi:hypothetical protein